MPRSMSSISSAGSCASVAAAAAGQVAVTSSAGRHSTSSGQYHSKTLHDAGSWRRQVCEVRPSRSSTLGRPATITAAAHDSGAHVDDDKPTSTSPGGGVGPRSPPPSVTARGAPPRPPARSSSTDCCRCRWLRAAAAAEPAGRARDAPVRRPATDDGDGRLPPPPPPPPPPPTVPRSTSELPGAPSTAVSPTSRELCVQLDQVSCVAGSSSCLLYTSPSPRDRQKSRMPSSA